MEEQQEQVTATDVEAEIRSDEATVGERMAALRGEALDAVHGAADDLARADRAKTAARAALETACATAIDAGVDLQTVADAAGWSAGTVRGWGRPDG